MKNFIHAINSEIVEGCTGYQLAKTFLKSVAKKP